MTLAHGFDKAARLLRTSAQPVAVVAPFGVNGICFVRALAQGGIPAVGIARDLGAPAAKTRHCAAVACPDIATPALIELLAQLGCSARARPVLFPLADVQVLLVSEHRNYLSAWYDFALPAHSIIEMLVNKLRFSAWAAEQGLPIARTRCVRSGAELKDIAEQVAFPCILKPRYRDERWESSGLPKGFKLQGPNDLRACYDFVSRHQNEVVISEWVEGPDSDLYIGHIYVGRPGAPPAVFLTRKIRQYPPHIGTTTLATAWRDEELSRLTADVYARLDYHGFGAVEMKVDARDGRARILEPMAGRCSMIWYPALLQGLNLAHLAYCDIVGRPLPAHQPTARPAKWLDERPDLGSALRSLRCGELTLGQYLQSLAGPKVYVHLDWRDPLPGVFLVAETVGLILRKLFEGRRRPRS